MAEKTKKDKVPGGLIVLFAVLLAAVIAVIVVFIVKVKTDTVSDEAMPPVQEGTTYVEYPDVDKYFKENADVKTVVPVDKSKDIFTEKEVFKEFGDRGFDSAVTADYAINGGYYGEEKEIAETGKEKHPSYQTAYTSKNGDVWTVCVINGQVMATPLSYLIQSDKAQSVIVSESDTVTSYDSVGNRFFVSVPHKETVKVIKVDKVDSKTLDGLTAEEIDKR